MTTVAFIPVRGGSKSIPLKNIRPLCGKPLVYWTVKAACECRETDRVYVATDSGAIRDAVEHFVREEGGCFRKVQVIGRSAESATDTASTEQAMLEFARQADFDRIVLIQATSPMLRAEDLDRGFEKMALPGTDSVLSVVRQKRFHWAEDENGAVKPTNYDVYRRPRRQDFPGYLTENGAFYITTRKGLLESGNRVSGVIRGAEMPEDTLQEIDEPADWVIIEALMKRRADKEKSIPEIRMLLTDCDGCLTDGGMYYTEQGDEIKKFNTRDGVAFALLREKGVVRGIVTGEKVALNRRRAEKLGLEILEEGCRDKWPAIQRLCRERGIAPEQVCYIGDERMDLEALRNVGFGCCPADAAPEVKAAADYVCAVPGGRGVVREVVRYLGLSD